MISILSPASVLCFLRCELCIQTYWPLDLTAPTGLFTCIAIIRYRWDRQTYLAACDAVFKQRQHHRLLQHAGC